MAADERVAYGTDRASGEPPRVQVQAGGLLPHFAQLTDEESLCAQTGGALDDRACDSQTELPCAQAQADALTRLGQPCAARSPMPLMCTSFEPGCLSQAIESIDDEDVRRIARAEALYFTADPDGACCESEPYLTSSNPALRMSACFICAYANLSRGQIPFAKACLDDLASMGQDCLTSEDPTIRAAYVVFATAASVLLHLEPACSEDELRAAAPYLPEGLRLFAAQVDAHRAYLAGEYGRCIGIAETALAMKRGSYPISELFLHLVAAMGWMGQKSPDRARAHFVQGWDIARPDGLIELIGEHHGLLQGVLETCLKDDYPDDFARIIQVTYRFSAGWRRIHNPTTGEKVADNLTTTEFTFAMLACRGWSNDQIAAHMGVSRGTVKNRLSSVYVKLGIQSRSELEKYMLR